MSLQPDVTVISTLHCIHDGRMHGVIATGEFLGDLVPHGLNERFGKVALDLEQNGRLPLAGSRLKRRAMSDVAVSLNNSAVRHGTLHRQGRQSVGVSGGISERIVRDSCVHIARISDDGKPAQPILALLNTTTLRILPATTTRSRGVLRSRI